MGTFCFDAGIDWGLNYILYTYYGLTKVKAECNEIRLTTSKSRVNIFLKVYLH